MRGPAADGDTGPDAGPFQGPFLWRFFVLSFFRYANEHYMNMEKEHLWLKN